MLIQEFCADMLDAKRSFLSECLSESEIDSDDADAEYQRLRRSFGLDSDRPLAMETRALPIMVLGKGFTSLHHKLDALLHAFRLELGGDEQIVAYNKRVISCCSDQGVEFGIATAPMIDLAALAKETESAINVSVASGFGLAIHDFKPTDTGLTLTLAFSFETD